jgi:serine/threonine protein kinase
MIGKTIGHYKIVDKLGEGGMGAVYKAEDTTLNRLVAIKALSSHLLGNEEARERFVREAQAASSLNHANITTVHELLEDEDEQFIVMEYVDGKTIRDIVESSHVSIRKAVDIIIQAAEALETAHNQGILHRDVKSANIMVSMEGNVKVMDFGLAHLEEKSKLTRTGTTMGTLAYSSPEQLVGSPVDRRSEVFSLGVVFYELLTGELPFKSPSEGELVFEIINTEQDQLTICREDVPENVCSVVNKMLIKKSELRYQSCSELLTDLRAIRSELETTTVQIATAQRPFRSRLAKPANIGIMAMAIVLIAMIGVALNGLRFSTNIPTISVLPFINQGPAEDAYLELGITEEVITRLSALEGLNPIDKSSVLSYRDPNTVPESVGRDLGVEYVLTGTFRRLPASSDSTFLRFTPRLIQVSTRAVIWSQPFNVDISHLQAVSVNIAQQTVDAIGVELLDAEIHSIQEYPTEDLAAYRLYMKGNDLFAFAAYGGRRDSTIKAIEYYREASELDPESPLILAALGRTQAWMLWQHNISTYLDEADEIIERAVNLAPEHPMVRVAYGQYFYWGYRDFDRARHELEKALELQPNNPAAIHALGSVICRQGDMERGAELFEAALILNPREYSLLNRLIRNLISLRRWDEAEYFIERLDSLFPERILQNLNRARLYLLRSGDISAALEALEAANIPPEDRWLSHIGTDPMASIFPFYYSGMRRRPDHDRYYLIQGRIALTNQQRDRAIAYFDSAQTIITAKDPDDSHDPYFIAINHINMGICYAVLGDHEMAVQEGMRALDIHDIDDDAVEGDDIRERFAEILVLTGRFTEALSVIEDLLMIPSEITVPLLRVDPRWRPLWNLQEFQELLRKYN